MRSESFAEILREKLEKSQNQKANSHYSESIINENLIEMNLSENLNLSRFQSTLFEQTPNSFKSKFKAKADQTAYKAFKREAKGQETSNRSQYHVDNNSSIEKNSESKPTELTPRPRTTAHKLNEEQTKSMTYFINEAVFLLEDFTKDELKKAYKRLALKKHPDRQNGCTQHFIELQKHYENLTSVHKR